MTWLQLYDTAQGKTMQSKEVGGGQGLGGKDECIGRAWRILRTEERGRGIA